MPAKQIIIAAAAAGLLLTACGDASSDDTIHYIKTSVTYDTITDMYADPDSYLGKIYHISGKFYPGTDHDSGEKFYSVYAEGSDGHGIGIELDGKDVSFDGLEDFDTVTVEGRLEKQKMQHEGEEIEVLILRLTDIKKKEAK